MAQASQPAGSLTMDLGTQAAALAAPIADILRTGLVWGVATMAVCSLISFAIVGLWRFIREHTR